MNWDELFILQKELDTKIVEQHNLKGKSFLPEKILALQVELGELANETRCFKYWSLKKPSDKNIILEEYVDCIHFLLSLGLEYNYTHISFKASTSDSSLTEQFINICIDLNDFTICSSKDNYLTLFNDFLTLGSALNFTEEDIFENYCKKNQINHERQASAY